jgi:hypothetical protein
MEKAFADIHGALFKAGINGVRTTVDDIVLKRDLISLCEHVLDLPMWDGWGECIFCGVNADCTHKENCIFSIARRHLEERNNAQSTDIRSDE